METELKTPTQPRELGEAEQRKLEADTKRINDFKEYITVEAEAPKIRKGLTSIYMAFTRMLIMYPNLQPLNIVDDLYYLTAIIEILE